MSAARVRAEKTRQNTSNTSQRPPNSLDETLHNMVSDDTHTAWQIVLYQGEYKTYTFVYAAHIIIDIFIRNIV